MILYNAVNLDKKSECYVIQILPINVCSHLQCLDISLRLQFLVNTLTELLQEKEDVKVVVEYSDMKSETALKSVLTSKSNIHFNSK